MFIDQVTPLLTLNCPNPEFRLSRSLSPNSSLNTSHSSSEDVSMASLDTVEDEESKRAKRILEMVSLWVCHTIRLSSTTVDPVLYELSSDARKAASFAISCGVPVRPIGA